MTLMTSRRLLAATALAGLATLANAQTFPDKPVRLIVPYPPGGSHSLHAGAISTAAEAHFGQPMISVVRAGGGGSIAATEVSRGEADGYTVLFGDPTINSLRPQTEKLAYSAEDFVAIARINYSPAVFVVAADAPYSDLSGMVAWSKANPGKFIYSSDNVNGFTYVAFEMLKVAAGADMKGITFGGGGPALAQLLGGHTMAYAGDPALLADHIAAKKVKPICATDTQRYPTLPEVPTCKEAGHDIVWQFWRGALVKKGTPPERIAKLRESFDKLAKDEGFGRMIKGINSRVDYLSGEAFEQALRRERQDLKTLYSKLKP